MIVSSSHIQTQGSSVEVLLYGATVISWKTGTQPVERLFVSSKAALDGSKPIRGGIPIVFPCFGAPSHPEHARLSQHGFARNQAWTFDSVVTDDGSGVSVRLTLTPTASIKAVYDRSFELAYVVTLGEDALATDLHVKNTSRSSVYPEGNLEFQALFHTYIRAPADQVLVFPLQNKKYYDKTETSEEGRNTAKTEMRAGVDVRTFTDSVYEDAAMPKYEVRWPGCGIEIKVEGLKDVVVWNPQREQAARSGTWKGADGALIIVTSWVCADIHGDRERYVCVEPGHVRGYVKLEPGQTWIGRQLLRVVMETE
ncbi:galactose mutarotase-like domain-containing protein [Boletus reticuloceps]|uniref:Glucose-6-phosphate 1-epimerase n=1 Tax=Boletus reticuloceps TaxID=495285 RepID=A0A8I2YZU8_9AGAM|nr:galactose mutarotase-like domain-containing protein [Boletus reticuloceps]